MPTLHAGLAIVGGGPMGAWLALEATRDADPLSAPVVLFEAGDPADRAGPVTAFDPDGGLLHGAAPELAPLLRDGARALANFEPQTGRPIGHCVGGLVLVGEDSTWADLGEPVDPTWLERRGFTCTEGPLRHLSDAAWTDPGRTHAEVLALARTRGAITRPGTTVEALIIEDGRVTGFETDQGPCTADRVVVTCEAALARVLPDHPLLAHLVEQPWCEHRHESRLIRAEAGLTTPPDLSTLSTDPMALEAFFATGEPLEPPHPALLWRDGRAITPNPTTGHLVTCTPDPQADPSSLLQHALSHTDQAQHTGQAQHTEHRGTHHAAPDHLPLVGPDPDHEDLWLALALTRATPLLAPALAPGLTAQLQSHPVAAYSPALLDPARLT